MDIESYFLAFARLARRSVLFWGHAVTSGISASAGLRIDPGRSVRETGGIDYFVSSWLFEDLGRQAQRKYSERYETWRARNFEGSPAR